MHIFPRWRRVTSPFYSLPYCISNKLVLSHSTLLSFPRTRACSRFINFSADFGSIEKTLGTCDRGHTITETSFWPVFSCFVVSVFVLVFSRSYSSRHLHVQFSRLQCTSFVLRFFSPFYIFKKEKNYDTILWPREEARDIVKWNRKCGEILVIKVFGVYGSSFVDWSIAWIWATKDASSSITSTSVDCASTKDT